VSATPLQLFAVSALIGECQALAASGILKPSQSAALRCLVNHTQAAFDNRRRAAESATTLTDEPANGG
jgi:hypothetical protein